MRSICDFVRQDKTYFAENKASIAEKNNRMLAESCVLYSFVLAFYTILSIVIDAPVSLKIMYYVYDGIHLVICLAVFARPAGLKASFKGTQFYCGVFEFAILSFFALEGAFASTTQPSLYIPIAILLVLLVFTHDVRHSAITIFAYIGIYAILSCYHKTPEAAASDVSIAIATLISSIIEYYLIAKMRRSEQTALTKYEKLSRTDALTGLNNKASLELLCESVIRNSSVCTLIMIDLDDFKAVNDKFGHNVGDEVLSRIGILMKSVFRAEDIVGRFGGDEFVILFDDCADAGLVQYRLDAFRHQVDEMEFSVPALKLRCSAGITFKRDGDDFNSMFARADRALYLAKRSGKNGLVFDSDANQAPNR